MGDPIDDDLLRRTRALLEPGEIDLVGLVVHTDLGGDEEPALHRATVAIGDCIAEQAGYDASDTYVYSGNDDPEFGLNQHQGRTIADDAFVWECQQLRRDGTYAVVFYYEAGPDQAAIVEAVEGMGFDAVALEP